MQKHFSIPVLLGCMLALSACGGDDKKSSSSAPPATPALKTYNMQTFSPEYQFAIKILDAETQELVPVKTKILVKDDDPNLNFHENVGLESVMGLVNLVLKHDIVASKEKPVKLRLIAQAEGYFTSSIDVTFDGSSLSQDTIYLINVKNPPEGVAVATQANVKASDTGILTTPIQLTAKINDPNIANTSASFSLPTGTILKDSSGNPLTGDLDVTIGYFSPDSPSLINAFPGGLAPERVRVGGQDQQGRFISAGLIVVDIIDSEGRKAHKLENNRAEMTIQSPKGLWNPETKQEIKQGDKIPIWSHSESNGLWTREQIGQFRETAEGNFEVNYTTSHLSVWNLDWVVDICEEKGLLQFSDPKLDLTKTPYNFKTQLYLKASYLDEDGTAKTIAYQQFPFFRTTPITLTGLPKEDAISFTISERFTSDYQIAKDSRGYWYNQEVLTTKELGTVEKKAGECSIPTLNITPTISTAQHKELPPQPELPPRPIPQTRTLPVTVLITPPDGFSRDQIETLLNAMKSLTDETRQKVLDYTHPNNSTQPFKITEQSYQKLKDFGLSNGQIASIQSLVMSQFENKQINGYIFGQVDGKNNFYLSSNGGVTLPKQDVKVLGANLNIVIGNGYCAKQGTETTSYPVQVGSTPVPPTGKRDTHESIPVYETKTSTKKVCLSRSWHPQNIINLSNIQLPKTIKEDDTEVVLIFEDLDLTRRFLSRVARGTFPFAYEIVSP